MRPIVALLVVGGLWGCTGAPGSAPAEPLPVVAVVPGQATAVDVGRYAPVTFRPPPGIDVSVAGDRAEVRVGPAFEGHALVPFESGGATYALAVEGPARQRFRLTFLGRRAGDATVVDFRLTHVGDGPPPELDEEDALALWGDRPVSDNAIDVDVGDGVVGVDLDAVGPERGGLRVAVGIGGAVSNWVEVAVEGRRVQP